MCSRALQTFLESFERVRGLSHVGRALEGQALASVDMTEAFRASVVLAVSALDSYVHNLCVEAIVQSYLGNRARNSCYGEAQVRLTSAEVGVNSGSASWLQGELRAQFGRDTYQRAEDVAKALRFVDDRPKKWVRIAGRLGDTPESVKLRLNSVVDRRNMIVHEADIDPAWGCVRPLKAGDAEVATEYVFRLVKAVEMECW